MANPSKDPIALYARLEDVNTGIVFASRVYAKSRVE